MLIWFLLLLQGQSLFQRILRLSCRVTRSQSGSVPTAIYAALEWSEFLWWFSDDFLIIWGGSELLLLYLSGPLFLGLPSLQITIPDYSGGFYFLLWLSIIFPNILLPSPVFHHLLWCSVTFSGVLLPSLAFYHINRFALERSGSFCWVCNLDSVIGSSLCSVFLYFCGSVVLLICCSVVL